VVEEQAEVMVDKFVSRLPKSLSLNKAAVAVLKAAARERPRLRARLWTLLSKPYLAQLTPQLIRQEATRQNLSPSQFVRASGQLVVLKRRPTRTISMLDEALVRDGFSHEFGTPRSGGSTRTAMVRWDCSPNKAVHYQVEGHLRAALSLHSEEQPPAAAATPSSLLGRLADLPSCD
jgi:hypothetical protein